MKTAEEWLDIGNNEGVFGFDSNATEEECLNFIRLIQQDAQPQLLPIDSAPKDGTGVRIIRRANGKQISALCHWTKNGNIKGYWAGWNRRDGEPTHWMPLPQPPGKETP